VVREVSISRPSVFRPTLEVEAESVMVHGVGAAGLDASHPRVRLGRQVAESSDVVTSPESVPPPVCCTGVAHGV